MKSLCRVFAVGFLAIFAATSAGCALAATHNSDQGKEKDPFANLKFRNIGPAIAGGRVSSVVGVPGQPNIMYVGAAGGGVFKSVDGGNSWKAVFTDQATSSIGDITLASGNPDLVWVGTGEPNIRNDITDGHGVYFSPDGGKSWQFKGLADAGQIGRVVVDPRNRDRVFVAAVGHAWGPNKTRGVFRSTDGGKTWKKVLYVNDTTGASDVVMSPGNPEVLYATMWDVRRRPWTLQSGGPGSGIYRSTDGGDTWQKIEQGLPDSPLGRIALAAAPSNPKHLYALVEAGKGMLWESRDMGDHWTRVSDNHSLDVRPFYFSQIRVDPRNEDHVFFLSFRLLASTDGGKTVHWADKGVHPDHHALWIDPSDPDHLIQGNDGGAFLSTDGAKSWRFLNNLPIEQFYMVAADTRTPYQVCGGLQDNSAWCGPAHSLSGSVDGSGWYVATGGDGEYAVPAPSNPNIVYADSQNGWIVRLDHSSHLGRYRRPYQKGVEEARPSDLKYRFNWTSPIAVAPDDADEVYLGGNVLFKSTNGGKDWQPISPDLTRNDKSKQIKAGGPIFHDMSGAETYDTILSITLAPTDKKVIWVGTDDGLVQVTRDGGQHWSNVADNISGAPDWARVYQIGVSPFDAGTAYVAFDAHQLDDRGAYVYKTTDYGKSWTRIGAGLPDNNPVFVVREDPNHRGLLVAGTDTGLYWSADAGRHWSRLKANFPTAPVWDVKFAGQGRDLIAATHGRGLFVLDDIRPLEEWSAKIADGGFHLFKPADGILFHHYAGGASPGQYSAPNGPEGPVVDYYLPKAIKATDAQKKQDETPVKITVTDAHGHAVATDYGPSRAGVNRFVWDMHYDGPRKLKYEKMMEKNAWFDPNQGPVAAPGSYHVTVSVGDHTASTTVSVSPDPNLDVPAADFVAETKAGVALRDELSTLNEMINRLDFMHKQLDDFRQSISGNADAQHKYADVLDEAGKLDDKLSALKDSVFDPRVQHDAFEDDIHYLQRFHARLANMLYSVGSGYADPPNAEVREEMNEAHEELGKHLTAFNALINGPVAAFNRDASKSGAPTLFTGGPLSPASAGGVSADSDRM
ncbi:MAG: hypothetical protein PVI37_05830 [Gammaproteobacteria bacterium]|jgi:photosystem II stability/assembly factor-like uncharacterized protein